VPNERDPYEILQLSPSAVPEVVEAAYRALALLYHPDRSADPDAARAMAELNWAFGELRDPEQRSAADQARAPIPVDPTPSSASLTERMQEAAATAVERDVQNPANVILDFGRYAGMSLGQIVRTEPGYLEWLRRQSSGLRYRHQINEVLSSHAARRAASSVE
jgi:curved DNA-binding protein CbpA